MSDSESKPLTIFSARACSAPLEEAAAIYTERTGTDVEISVCARHCAAGEAEKADPEAAAHDFLLEIAEYGYHDMAIGGAEYLLDDGEVRRIVQPGKRTLIAYRESALIVPADNPAGVETLADLARPGVKVGISVIDCLKGLWEDVSGKVGLADEIRRNVTFHATGCVAIVEATGQGLVDAAFAWTSFDHLGEGRIKIIPLPKELRVYRGTGVGLLSFSKQPDKALEFMSFLTTDEAVACYEKYGWVSGKTLRGE